MSSPGPYDEPENSTPASEEGIAVFPLAARDLAPEPSPPEPVRVGPLVPLAAAFGGGVALAPTLPLGSGAWAGAALLALAFGAIGPRIRAPYLRWPGLAAGFLCLGIQAAVVAEREAPAHHLSRLSEAALAAPIVVEGWVATPPDPQPVDTRDSGDVQRMRFVAEVTYLTLDGQRVPSVGRARLTVLGPPTEVR